MRFLLFACAEDREPIPLLDEIAKENFDFVGFYQLAKFKKGASAPAADRLLNQVPSLYQARKYYTDKEDMGFARLMY